jgi:dUTP pyrophosphatase
MPLKARHQEAQMNIKRFCEGAPLPVRKTEGAVGYDLVACAAPHELTQNGNILIPLGFGFEIPDGHVGIVAPRSSTSHWLLTGYVDPDYRGEVFAKTTGRLLSAGWVSWEKFDRIAQLIIVPVVTPELTVVDELSQTARGTGGNGSTGR